MSEGPSAFSQAQVDKMIKDRTAEVREQRNALQKQLNDKAAEFAQLEKQANGWKAQWEAGQDAGEKLTALQAEHDGAKTTWSRERILLGSLGSSYDEDVAAVVMAKYGKADKPGEFADWYASTGSQLPIVRAIAPQQQAPSEASNGAEQAAPDPAAPKPTNGAPNVGAKVSPGPDQPHARGKFRDMDQTNWASTRERYGLKPRPQR